VSPTVLQSNLRFAHKLTLHMESGQLNTLEMSLVIPNIGDESRTDISAYWVKGNGLKV
jgi:hypothetical protein